VLLELLVLAGVLVDIGHSAVCSRGWIANRTESADYPSTFVFS